MFVISSLSNNYTTSENCTTFGVLLWMIKALHPHVKILEDRRPFRPPAMHHAGINPNALNAAHIRALNIKHTFFLLTPQCISSVWNWFQKIACKFFIAHPPLNSNITQVPAWPSSPISLSSHSGEKPSGTTAHMFSLHLLLALLSFQPTHHRLLWAGPRLYFIFNKLDASTPHHLFAWAPGPGLGAGPSYTGRFARD